MYRFFKFVFLFWFGGSTYVTFEVFFRSHSHWTMFLLAGALFVFVDLLNEVWSWNILTQTLFSLFIVTSAEFTAGIVLNRWLGLGIWDYSNEPFNLMGQICLPFILMWIPLILLAIVVGDIIRWRFFREERPHYYIR